jgi:hypothetical protein
MPEKFDYEIALSFAGEDRAAVEPIAELLKSHGVSVFYDAFEKSRLWGKDLGPNLTELYFSKARFFVPFISANYAQKAWPRQEFKAALARAIQENQEYILPIRLDQTEIPGLLPSIVYVDYRSTSPGKIVELILEKLDHPAPGAASPSSEKASAARFGKIFVPRLKKEFTDRERDKFRREGFAVVADYFSEAMQQLASSDSDVEVQFTALHRHKFTCEVYVRGKLVNKCKLWLGSMGATGDDLVCFAEGLRLDPQKDSSYSDWVSVKDDGFSLYFEASGISQFNSSAQKNSQMDAQKLAEFFWKRFSETLNR